MKIMQLIPNLADKIPVRYTATLIVGRYADWLHRNPSFISPLLKYVVQGLQHKDVRPYFIAVVVQNYHGFGPTIVTTW